MWNSYLTPPNLDGLIMTAIHWEESPEGGKYWHPLYHALKEKHTTKDAELTKFLMQKYPNPELRSSKSQKNYRHAFKLIIKYKERFDNLPSVELLESLL